MRSSELIPSIMNTHPTPQDLFLKRLFDVVVAALMLLISVPLWLLIALLIKLDSRGPVFFRQQRVGAQYDPRQMDWARQLFEVWKFRTMYSDVNQQKHADHIQAYVRGDLDPEADEIKLRDDPRVTRIGRILRRTSLDELPQLINILRGEMSFVGPRPVPTYEVDEYDTWHGERLHALPGLTGPWQVYGRGRVTFDEQMEIDINYVRTRSFWLDVKLFLLTIPAVLKGDGAR